MPFVSRPINEILALQPKRDTRTREEVLADRISGRVLDKFHSPGPREFVVRGGFFNFFETTHDEGVYERAAKRLGEEGLGMEAHRYEDRKVFVDFGVEHAVHIDRIHLTSIGGAAVIGTARPEDLPGHVARIWPPEAPDGQQPTVDVA